MTNFYDYWFKLGTWNSEEAALLFNGKDPIKFGSLVKFPANIADGHKINRKEWQREVFRTYTIFETASQTDWASCFVELGNSYTFALFDWQPPKEASPGAFFYLAEMKGVNIPEKIREAYFNNLENIDKVKYRRAMVRALKSYKHQETNQDKTDTEPDEGGELIGAENKLPDIRDYESAFDALPLSVIADMFPIIKDAEKNLHRWKYYAGKASQNGLIDARVEVRRGRAQSTFNPYLVGRWVTRISDGLTPEFVNRKLSKNLPTRSLYLQDETFV